MVGLKPSTFLSLIPSAIEYLCNSSPKISAVVDSAFWFSSKTGVPVKPKNNALGNVSLMDESISPKVER